MANFTEKPHQNLKQKIATNGLNTPSVAWQRNRDSNPNKQSQSLSCYRYTIPLYRCGYYRNKIYYTHFWRFVKRKSTKNLKFCNNFVFAFVNAAFRNISAHHRKRIYVRLSSDYRAGIEHTVAADLDIISDYSAHLFQSRFNAF